jgi:WD40 repeat protein
VSILDVANDCNIATSIDFGGLNPLSAKWHPKDRFLTMAGQANSIVAVEAINDRYMKGRFLKSESPILCADFSPNGSKIVVGNEDGVVSFFDISGPNFLILYEMVLDVGGVKSVRWSPDDKYVVVGGADTLVIVSTGRGRKKSSSVPTSASGFSIRKVIRGMMNIRHIGIDYDCGTVAVCGESVRMLDAMNKFRCVLEIKSEVILATAWSRDGTLFASIGRGHDLTIYDTSSWRKMFTLSCVQAGLALAWGPTVTKGLQYLAYGGESKKVRIIEIRTQEESWEQVLSVPRNGVVNDLDWNLDGMLAVAVGDGTATVLDLAYLQCGQAVNEKDYRWQRQGIVCFTEIRRKNNSMQTVRWMPPIGSFLALGGTDGIIEMIDLTDRNQFKTYEMNVDEETSCDPEATTLKENRSNK